jgi:aryl-alcohol dehydrogenase-like predicted oxidoreductase
MTLDHSADLPSTAPDAMQAQTFAVLDAAWAAGVRHFDAARSYGLDEQFLSRWLEARGIEPAQVTVSSKWGYRYTANWATKAEVHEVKDHSLAHLDAQWPETRALLGRHLAAYQIHSATLETGVLSDERVLDRLAELRDLGLRIGLSVTGANQADLIDAALLITRGGRRLFDLVQATWNVLEPSAGPALSRAHALGVQTYAKEGLANGRLTPRGDRPDWLSFAAAQGHAPDALALGAALAQPFLDVVLSGAATVAQLQSNLIARHTRSADLTQFIESPAKYWSARSRLPWS